MRSFIGRPEFYDERPEIQREIFAREKERLIQEDLLEKDNIINIIKRVSNEGEFIPILTHNKATKSF